MQPRSKRANCPHTELTSDIVASSKMRMKFSPSGRPITWFKITASKGFKNKYTISTNRADSCYFFGTHYFWILFPKHEISANRSSDSYSRESLIILRIVPFHLHSYCLHGCDTECSVWRRVVRSRSVWRRIKNVDKREGSTRKRACCKRMWK